LLNGYGLDTVYLFDGGIEPTNSRKIYYTPTGKILSDSSAPSHNIWLNQLSISISVPENIYLAYEIVPNESAFTDHITKYYSERSSFGLPDNLIEGFSDLVYTTIKSGETILAKKYVIFHRKITGSKYNSDYITFNIARDEGRLLEQTENWGGLEETMKFEGYDIKLADYDLNTKLMFCGIFNKTRRSWNLDQIKQSIVFEDIQEEKLFYKSIELMREHYKAFKK
jgi:hypothetical protein